jgi:CheY-like chemotaxis protein
MLVDDDGVCLAMLARGLRRRGYDVTTFGDPREAMAALEQEPPDAVVTDMRMPHMTGLEVVEEVRARLGAGAPPVLVVSADGEEHLLLEAFRLGAVDYLLKPVGEVELGVKLARVLEKSASQAAIPQQIGEWVLGDCIGRGGTAAVFKAERASEPGATYALKVVWPHLTSSTETLLRFRREIDTLSVLDHPGLVTFRLSGREHDCFYYVMGYVEGGTLRDRIQANGAQPVADALDMIEAVAEPLHYLHEQGIVHRDVKPGNILFAGDRVVLGDFGLAKRLADHGITLGEEFIGTPLYLAPEVFETSEFGPSVDLYSLGVCAYEMLHGGRILEEQDSMRLIGRLLTRGLPAPRELLPDAPESVLELLDSLIARDPNQRPQDAPALQAAVQRARAGAGSGGS